MVLSPQRMNENVTFLGLALLAPSARQQEW
jgi:hypothetical protein